MALVLELALIYERLRAKSGFKQFLFGEQIAIKAMD